jgi:hypothetical protein
MNYHCPQCRRHLKPIVMHSSGQPVAFCPVCGTKACDPEGWDITNRRCALCGITDLELRLTHPLDVAKPIDFLGDRFRQLRGELYARAYEDDRSAKDTIAHLEKSPG